MSWQSKPRGAGSESVMDVFLIEAGHPERILVSAIDRARADDLLNWFCYTKPMGGDLKIIARPRSRSHPVFCVHTAGTDIDPTGK